jgi:monoamine oxidase
MSISRRQFIRRCRRPESRMDRPAGARPDRHSGTGHDPQLNGGHGQGRSVVILGAGIAGLIAAWELGKAGYRCTMLEARDRVGGRNWTVRRGDRIEMNDGSVQTCTFDNGHYFNAGPARLPSHHQTILGYCREFGVPLEVEVNMSRSALLQSDAANGGRPIEMRQAVHDMRGQVSELLAKCTEQHALDAPLTGVDHERFLDFLRGYGDLDKNLHYAGSARAGYQRLPTAGAEVGTLRDPVGLNTLLDPVFWEGPLFDDHLEMQPTMFQPVGGMDRIVKAFHARLKDVVKLGEAVLEIRNGERAVSIVHRNRRSGRVQTITRRLLHLHHSAEGAAGHPGQLLRTVRRGDPPGAGRRCQQDRLASAALLGNRSADLRRPELHPSRCAADLVPERRLLRAAGRADRLLQLRCRGHALHGAAAAGAPAGLARRDRGMLFPGRASLLERGITVAWNHMPWNLAPWTKWDTPYNEVYRRLDQPEGRVYLAGEHLSHISGWQEGSAQSVHRVLKLIAERVAAA